MVDIPGTIDITGATDESDEMQAFFNGLSNGSVVNFPPAPAVICCEQTLRLISKNNITFNGNGCKIRAFTDGSHLPAWDGKEITWPRQRTHLRIEGCNTFVLNDLHVHGNNENASYDVNKEAQHAIDFIGGNGFTINDLQVTNVWGDGICLTAGPVNGVVDGFVFDGVGRQGLGITECDNWEFMNFTMQRIARTAIDLEPVTTIEESINDVHVHDGTMTAPIANYIVGNLGTGLFVTNIVIEDINIFGKNLSVLCNGSGENAGPRANYTIRNLVSNQATNHPPALKFVNITNVLVEGCVQPFAGKGMTGPAVEFISSCGVVQNNTFTGAPMVSSGVVPCAAGGGGSKGWTVPIIKPRA